MGEPRKIFRIEQTPAARVTRRSGDNVAPLHQSEIVQALGALQALMAAQAPSPPLAAPGIVRHGADDGHAALRAGTMDRIARELEAVTAGSTQATHKILAAAEEIDQLADNLSAALKGRIEQDAAEDIADAVLRIFEACNFQDLIGQRVTKVMQALISGALTDAPDDPASDLHGPRLDTDRGHLSQREIDALFGD